MVLQENAVSSNDGPGLRRLKNSIAFSTAGCDRIRMHGRSITI
jgi:hypothetical protein